MTAQRVEEHGPHDGATGQESYLHLAIMAAEYGPQLPGHLTRVHGITGRRTYWQAVEDHAHAHGVKVGSGR